MKVLHISSARTWRGGEQQIAYLLEGLQSFDVEQVIFCPENSPLWSWCKDRSFQVHAYRKANLSPRVVRQLIRLIRNVEPDLIHMHDSHGHTYGVLAHTFGPKIPMVLHRRVDFPVKPNVFSRWKYNHPGIKAILCVSGFIRQLLLPDIRRTDILYTVYSGIDPDRFGQPQITSKGLRSVFSVPAGEVIIANIASLAPHKDYYTFVRTVRLLKDQGLQAHYFAIGGDGGEMETVRSFAQELDLEKEITFTGFRTDVAALAQDIDVLLITSKEEGLCTTILDAFAGKIPVVATDAGGIPELVKNEITGLLAPIKDHQKLAHQVVRMLDHTELRNSCKEGGYELAKSFDYHRMARTIYQHYAGILKG
ncbi:MAG: glycosyltransferase family 4 protein [Saprospiraceae bacterium]